MSYSIVNTRLFLDKNPESKNVCFVVTVGGELIDDLFGRGKEHDFIFVYDQWFVEKQVVEVPDNFVEYSDAISGNFAFERIAILKSGKPISVRYAKEWLQDGARDVIGYTHWFTKNFIEKLMAKAHDSTEREASSLADAVGCERVQAIVKRFSISTNYGRINDDGSVYLYCYGKAGVELKKLDKPCGGAPNYFGEAFIITDGSCSEHNLRMWLYYNNDCKHACDPRLDRSGKNIAVRYVTRHEDKEFAFACSIGSMLGVKDGLPFKIDWK